MEGLKMFVGGVMGAWLAINGICMVNGADDGQPSSTVHEHEKCHKFTRWSYVFPGYVIGCWMSTPINRGEE